MLSAPIKASVQIELGASPIDEIHIGLEFLLFLTVVGDLDGGHGRYDGHRTHRGGS